MEFSAIRPLTTEVRLTPTHYFPPRLAYLPITSKPKTRNTSRYGGSADFKAEDLCLYEMTKCFRAVNNGLRHDVF